MSKQTKLKALKTFSKNYSVPLKSVPRGVEETIDLFNKRLGKKGIAEARRKAQNKANKSRGSNLRR